MYWPNSSNSDINGLIRGCVRAEMKHGPRNECGAIDAVAAGIGVSPQIVRLRCRDHVTGTPRVRNLRERCWEFLDRIAATERAWAEGLAAEIARQRAEFQLEGGENAGSLGAVAGVLALAEGDVAAAGQSLGEYRAATEGLIRP